MFYPALIRYTSLRPYWNVPSDLAAERIEVLPDRILLYVHDGDAAVAFSLRRGVGLITGQTVSVRGVRSGGTR